MTESAREQALGRPISRDPKCDPAVDPTVDPRAVMCKLDNPRGLAFDAQGALYVAEAGRGGPGPDRCIVSNNQTYCYGPTGAVSRLWGARQERVAEGLPSIARTDGTRAEGPNGISMRGVREAYLTIGLEEDPAIRNLFPELAGFGQLVHLRANGRWRFVADIAGFDAEHNPDPGSNHSNPFGILAHRGGHLVTDASGNTLLRVGAKGDISVLAIFPSRGHGRSTDSVPTSVTTGPGGDYYVSELTGFPLVDGAANIYRVKRGHDPNEVCSLESVHPADEKGRHGAASPSCGVFLSGFRAIIDVAFDRKGDLYVLQHATAPGAMGPGLVWRVDAPDYTTRTPVLEGLNRPTSIAFGRDGALYVTNRGLMAGSGEVLRFERFEL